MAVTVTNDFTGPFVPDGVATAFPFDFAALSAAEVTVLRLAADGTQTIISPASYSVSIDPSGGGTATFSVAPAAGDPLYLVSDPSFEQQADFTNQGSFSPRTVNLALDRAAARDIALLAAVSRAPLAPPTETMGLLPSATARAGMYFGFDAEGNPIATSGTGSDPALRTDLVGNSGFTLIKYKPAFAGTFARTAAALSRVGGSDDTNVMHFVDPLLDSAIVDESNTTDLTAYIQNAITNGLGRVVFPSGAFRFTSLASSRYGLHIAGAGEGRTKLLRTATTGDAIAIGDGTANPNDCSISGMTLAALSAQTSGAIIRVRNGHNFRLETVRFGSNLFRACQLDGGAGQFLYHIKNIEVNSASDAAFVVGEAGGIVQDLWLDRLVVDCLGVGFDFVNASGVYASDIDAIHCSNGFRARPDSGQRVGAFFAQNTLADSCTSHGWKLAPTTTGAVVDWNMTGIWAATCGQSDNGHGFFADTSGGGFIDGLSIGQSRFINSKGAGMRLVGGNNYNLNGNQVLDNSTQGSAAHDGLEIVGAVNGLAVSGGRYGAGGLFSLSNLQGYGISISSAADNIDIEADVRGNVTGGINDASTTVNKRIIGGSGYRTRNRGAGTVANGTSSVSISHGLAVTPAKADVLITPNSALVTAAQAWVSATTSTTFTVTTNVNVGADFFFGWDARVKGA